MSREDWERVRSLKARDLVRALQRDGFSLIRHRKGSHHRYRHPDGRRVTLPFSQGGETFAPKTLKNILVDQAEWGVEDLKRLGLLK